MKRKNNVEKKQKKRKLGVGEQRDRRVKEDKNETN